MAKTTSGRVVDPIDLVTEVWRFADTLDDPHALIAARHIEAYFRNAGTAVKMNDGTFHRDNARPDALLLAATVHDHELSGWLLDQIRSVETQAEWQHARPRAEVYTAAIGLIDRCCYPAVAYDPGPHKSRWWRRLRIRVFGR